MAFAVAFSQACCGLESSSQCASIRDGRESIAAAWASEPTPRDFVRRAASHHHMEEQVNLNWVGLTERQRGVLSVLSELGPRAVPRELCEQLLILGLVEPSESGLSCISALGETVLPTTQH